MSPVTTSDAKFWTKIIMFVVLGVTGIVAMLLGRIDIAIGITTAETAALTYETRDSANNKSG